MWSEWKLNEPPITEAEWIAGTKPSPMLLFLRGKGSARKLRLFGVACCRQQWDAFNDERNREAIQIGELFADGRAGEKERVAAECLLQDARDSLEDEEFGLIVPFDVVASTFTAEHADSCSSAMVYRGNYDPGSFEGIEDELLSEQADYLREIFGNPFRPARFDPRWRTADVLGLAAAIYDDRAFDRLPLLADALMDAGCPDDAILTHCRSPGPHVRGCWVVDLILGKS